MNLFNPINKKFGNESALALFSRMRTVYFLCEKEIRLFFTQIYRLSTSLGTMNYEVSIRGGEALYFLNFFYNF